MLESIKQAARKARDRVGTQVALRAAGHWEQDVLQWYLKSFPQNRASVLEQVLDSLPKEELEVALFRMWKRVRHQGDASSAVMNLLRDLPDEESIEKTAKSFWRFLSKNESRLDPKLFSKLGTELLKSMKDSTGNQRLQKSLTELWSVMETEEKIRFHAQTEVVCLLDYEKFGIQIHCDSLFEHTTRRNSVAKEPELVQWIENVIEPGDVFFDIGANIGAYSLITAAIYGEKVQTFAFEPAYPSFKQLARNIHLNQFEDFISPVPIALTNTRGLATFQLASLVEGKSFNYLSTPHESAKEKLNLEEARTQSVLKLPLDDFVKYFGAPKPTVMKIDIDGYELEFLEGAKQCLANPKLRSVHIELGEGRDLEPVLNKLTAFGLDRVQETPRGGQAVNYVFGRKPGQKKSPGTRARKAKTKAVKPTAGKQSSAEVNL